MTVQSPDDRPVQHYSTRHRVVAWISRTLFENITYTVRRGLIQGMKRRGGMAWLPEFLTPPGRTPEQSFWMNEDLRGLVVYDVGAFHGLLTLFFASQAKQVVSYEPNTRNHKRLMENIGVNGLKNVTVRQVGVGAKAEVATMVASPLMMGGASIEPGMVAGLRNSKGPVLSEQISITTIDDDMRELGLPKPDFIKVDVEGGELAVLTGARNTLLAHHPRLFLEMHGETMNLKRAKVTAIVAFLNDAGYADIRHVESGTKITTENASAAAVGHLYCRQA